MTPRQFGLLRDRHNESLVHRELIAAYTTAAVINFSQFAPKDGVAPLDFMPTHPRSSARGKTDAQLEAEHNALIASLDNMAKASGGSTTWKTAS